MQIRNQAINFGIADVGSIEERDEIEKRKPRDEPKVDLPNEFLVLELLCQQDT